MDSLDRCMATLLHEEVKATEYFLGELDIIERINGMIDRCIKRLLMIRGAKSLSESSSTNIPLSRGKRAA
jgi:hypothetical protein